MVLRLAGGHAVGRVVVVRIEHLPTRRSFGVFVNLLIGSLRLVDIYTKPWQLQVGSLVTWLGESVNLVWARLPVPHPLLLLAQPTLVARPEASKPLIRFVAVCSFYLSCSFFNRHQKN